MGMMGAESQPSINFADRDLCFIDVETTGTVFGFHEVIDLACVRTSSRGHCIKREWTRRVRPRFPERITDAARRINGFSVEEWENADPNTENLWRAFIEVVSGCIPVCHNPSFDRGFISMAASVVNMNDLEVDYHWLGTESLAWPLCATGCVDSVSLGSLCAYFSMPSEPVPHTALGGALTCRSVFVRLMDSYLKGPRREEGSLSQSTTRSVHPGA